MTKTETDLLEVEDENDEAAEVLVEYDIATYPSDNTIQVLVEMWSKKDITIPDFQGGIGDGA